MKVEVVMLEAVIGLLNSAVMLLFTAMSAAIGLVSAGEVRVTVGNGEATSVPAPPRISSCPLPPPQDAIEIDSSMAAVHFRLL
ncbi:MAG TPA: hypothetical protein VLA56_15150 [Pseudomonadales bacterium]|nr:hypothetical protein [Pseudomonadales bacterium]